MMFISSQKKERRKNTNPSLINTQIQAMEILSTSDLEPNNVDRHNNFMDSHTSIFENFEKR